MASSKEIAELFDLIDIEEDNVETDSSGYNVDEEKVSSFENRCKDVMAVMEKEADPVNDNEIIANALTQAEEPKPKIQQPVEEEAANTSRKKLIEEVERDIKEFEIEEEIPDSNITKTKPTGKPEDDNPLDLFGSDLTAYHDIKESHPQFSLSDGSMAFRDFYRYKFSVLKSVTSRFAVLDLDSIRKESADIDIDHFIGGRAISPDLIQRKLDDSYRTRARLSSLMIDILEQFPSWERWSEMLKSKLWKDHELKGAHRRDGLTMEHMSDIDEYVSAMEGILDAAKHKDNMLKAAAESLSRQLSCLQLKEATGFSQKMEPTPSMDEVQKLFKMESTESTELDSLDSIGSGENIEAPIPTGKPVKVSFGVEDDELSKLG